MFRYYNTCKQLALEKGSKLSFRDCSLVDVAAGADAKFWFLATRAESANAKSSSELMF